MTTAAWRLDGRFGVRVLVTVAFVAFYAAGLGRLWAVGNAVIGVLHVNAAAFIRCIWVIRPLVTAEALQHLFRFGVLVSVVTILTLVRVFRLNVSSVIEVFDDAPFGMLAPLIALFRIAHFNNAHRRRFHGSRRLGGRGGGRGRSRRGSGRGSGSGRRRRWSRRRIHYRGHRLGYRRSGSGRRSRIRRRRSRIRFRRRSRNLGRFRRWRRNLSRFRSRRWRRGWRRRWCRRRRRYGRRVNFRQGTRHHRYR